MFQSLWEKIKAPIINMAKRTAGNLACKELDKLRAQSLEAFVKDGPRAVDRNFDKFQEKMKELVDKITFLPENFRVMAKEAIQTEGDKLQVNLKASVETGGTAAINSAFDMASTALRNKLS